MGRSQSQPRANSLSGSGLMSPGGAVAAGTPTGCAVGHDITAPPPPPPMGTSRGGGRGQGQGRASLVDVFGSISAALTAAARADGTQGDLPPPRDREQQGAVGQDLGQHSATGRAVLHVAGTGAAGGWCSGVSGAQVLRGVRDRARVRDRVTPLSPRHGAAPPPSLRGRAGQTQ